MPFASASSTIVALGDGVRLGSSVSTRMWTVWPGL